MQASRITQQTPLDIPIDKGTMPDWQRRFGYPLLFNLFLGESGKLYCTPGLQLITSLLNARASHFTPFNNTYIAVTNTQVVRISLLGTYSVIATIPFSGLPVQIDENLQNQITIVDGQYAYVIDQKNATFTQLGSENGFGFESPCSVVVLNTFTIVLDKNTGGWIISSPNNALNYPPLTNIPQIETQLTTAQSLETLNNNLYIFGSTGIERWESSLATNTYQFPFSKDTNFRKDFGAISTGCVTRGIGVIYFLSSRYVPMALSEGSIVELHNKDGSAIGMSRILSSYPDVTQMLGSFYSFKGNYFYHMTAPTTQISWVYNQNSTTWAQSDDLVLNSPPNSEAVITPDGLFQLSTTPSTKRRTWISERMRINKGQQQFRGILNGVECEMIQGNLQTTEPQNLELTISEDALSWSNTVPEPIGLTGETNARTMWGMNIAAPEFTLKIEYYGNYDFSIEKVTAYIN